VDFAMYVVQRRRLLLRLSAYTNITFDQILMSCKTLTGSQRRRRQHRRRRRRATRSWAARAERRRSKECVSLFTYFVFCQD
jgi:hypothetical protein